VRITAEHCVTAGAGADHDRRIDHVGNTRATTQCSDGASLGLVERHDHDHGEPQESSKACLTSAVAPRLRNNARRYNEVGGAGVCFVEQGLETSIAALERDQRTGVEREAGHCSAEPKRLTGPHAILLGGQPAIGGHLGQQPCKILIAATFLDRVGYERGHR